MIVADTNLIASLWVPNQMEKLAYAVLRKDPDWVSPLLWKSEFRNVLALYMRENIFELSVILQAIDEAEEYMDGREFQVNSTQVLNWVANSKCSAYDCEFIALADDLNIDLITFDKKILSAFPKMATHPEDFIS